MISRPKPWATTRHTHRQTDRRNLVDSSIESVAREGAPLHSELELSNRALDINKILKYG